MATTKTTEHFYTGDGSTTDFAVSFTYLKDADVKATLDHVATTAYTLPNAGTLRFTTAPANGVAIRVYRDTDVDASRFVLAAGSSIKAAELNENYDQLLFADQEKVDVDGISNEAVTTAKIRDLNVTTAKIADSAITTAKITDLNVTTAKIAESAITSAKIADGAIVDADINASANIAGSKLADNSVDLDKIVDADIVETADYASSWADDDTKIATVGSLAARHDVVVNANVNPPSSDQTGKQWLSTVSGNQVYKIYDGSGWRTVAVGQPFTPATTTIVRYVDTTNGSDAADVTGFLPQQPLQSIARAIELVNASSSGDGTLIKVAPGVYQETLPLRIKKNNVSIVGESMRSCFVHPTVATENNDMFEVDSGTYIANLTLLGLKVPTANQGSRNNSLDNDATYGLPSNQPFSVRFRTDVQPVILKSPYIQNCTHFSDAHFDNANFDPNTFPSTDSETYSAVAGDESSAPCGGGLLVDGSAVSSSSPIRSMVVDAFTQITLDGPGILVTNNGYAQLVSFFGTFAHYHAKAKNGGQINLSNCVSDFGRYGLIADGKSPSAIATATASAANSGATSITIGAITTDSGFHGTVTRPLNHMMVTIDGVDYGVVSSTANGSGWDIELTSGLTSNITNTTVSFALRSYISTGGHTFEFVGVGTDYGDHPDKGGVPVEANQVVELNGGKVWQSSTDHVGKFKAGDVLVVDQVAETVDLKDTTVTGNITISGDIVSVSNSDIDLDPNGSGVVVFKGNATKGSGQFKLNCEQNSHGITIKGPPHSAAASYTLTLPNTDGNADEVLKTDGSGNLSWTAGYSDSDVDTHLNQSTASSGQVLSWDGSDYDWVAQSSGGGGGLSNNATGTNSLGIGTNTLNSEQSGAENNTAFGDEALTAVTTGDNNVAIGHEAGIALTTGSRNIFIGKEAGKAHDTYSGNIYIGYQTGLVHDRGAANVLIGNSCESVFSGSGVIPATFNTTGVGEQALRSCVANGNTAVGMHALKAVTTGPSNTAVGRQAGETLTTGTNNLLLGYQATPSAVTVSNEITLGNANITSLRIPGLQSGASDGQVLTFNSSNGNITLSDGGATNIDGLSDGHTNAYGSVGLGANALANETTTTGNNKNTATGEYALTSLTSGYYNVANGWRSLQAATTGYQNVGIGYDAGRNITTGINNVCVGHQAGYSATTVNANTFVGDSSGYNFTGARNTAIGWYSMYGAGGSTGTDNTCLGNSSGLSITSGIRNTCIGKGAGDSLNTGSNNLVLGYNADPSSATVSNEITLGNDSVTSLRIPGLQSGATDGQVLTYNSTNGNITLADAGGSSTGRTDSASPFVTSLGHEAADSVGSTSYNVISIGYQAAKDTTGRDNIAIGRGSLYTNSSGEYNVAVGTNALYSNTTASKNVSVGINALYGNTTGYENTGLGYRALYSNTTALYNTAVGSDTLYSCTTGARNTATGAGALGLNTTGEQNTASGHYAMLSNTTGSQNTATGYLALQLNTTGQYNAAFGRSALQNNTASYNTAVGHSALLNNTSGDENVALGYQAGQNITTGQNNTAVGTASLKATTTSSWNTALGYKAGTSNTTGQRNVFLGYAGYSNTTGDENTSVGYGAGYSNTFENGSTYVGSYAGQSQIGPNNVSVGTYTLYGTSGSSGIHNTAVGYMAGYAMVGGDRNTLVGSNAGDSITSGDNNTCIGNHADTSSATVDNEITLGNVNVATLRCNTQSISSLSDGRDKTEVEDLPLGLEFINTLRPVKFKWDTRDGNGKDGSYDAGFIAQDLQSAQSASNAEYLKMVMDSNPDRLEARYGQLIPVLVQAIKDLKAEIDTLKANA